MPNLSSMTEAELDRIAAGIRPSWELDDAPFRPSGMASPQLEALLASNGHVSHTNGAGSIAPQSIAMIQAADHDDLKTRIDPVPPAAMVEAPLVARPAAQAQHTPAEVPPQAALPVPAPQVVAEARAVSDRPPPPAPVPILQSQPPPAQAPSQSQRPSTSATAQADPFAAPTKPPARAARAKSTSSSDFQAIKKSNKGLYIALGGGAVVAIVAVIAFASSGSKTGTPDTTVKTDPSSKIGAAAQTREIPPPPATDDLPAPTATQAAATATAVPTPTADTAAPTATQVAQAQTATPPTATAQTHASNNPPPHNTNSTTHASPPPVTHPNPPAGGAGGKGKGGIVRDVPF